MIVYYVEVNVVCMLFLALLRLPLKGINDTSVKQRILILMMWSAAAFCTCDMIAGIFRGMLFPGAGALIEISNGLYFEMLVVISYLWYIYARARLDPNGAVPRKTMLLAAVPGLAFTLLQLLNPITHFMFSITPENLYKRGNGVFLHWVIVWAYFLVPTVKVLRSYLAEKSSIKKQELLPLLFFALPPFIASMIQMIFYGVTTTQVGITISIAMICLKNQDAQILTDSLTGINNRRAFANFMENRMQHSKDAVYTLMMIDVNHFKQVNDQYGHVTGDAVLKMLAESLKEACKVLSNRVLLARFGGDEFVILGIDFSDEEFALLRKTIAAEIKKRSESKTVPCEITVSIGYTQGKCAQEADLKELLNRADRAMYLEKARR